MDQQMHNDLHFTCYVEFLIWR